MMLPFDQLIQNLTDTTQPSVVRSSAIEHLAAQGDSRALGFLIEALADSDSMVRREAAKALQNLGTTGATEPLLEALQTESKDLTVWAMLEAIGELGNPTVLPTLEALNTVDSILTRIEVKKSIRRIQERYSNGDPPELTKEEEITASQTDDTEAENAAQAPHETESTEQEITAAEPELEEARADLDTEPQESDEETEGPDPELPELEAETEIPDMEFPALETETEIPDPEAHDSEAQDPEAHDSEESREIDDLVNTISRSPRLAGSSITLPILAPNAATVPYQPNVPPSQTEKESFFLAIRHPGRYLSKRWVSRTRVYLLLWGVLLAATVVFIQYQKHRGAAETIQFHSELSGTELPDLVKRSLAEGDFYIQEGHYRKAIGAYQLSRNFGAVPMETYRKLGFAYFKEGQYALAVEAYTLYLKKREQIAPSAFTAEASLAGVYPTTSVETGVVQDYETYNVLGTAYMKLGRFQDSQRVYQRAVQLAPKYGEAYNNLARLYVNGYQQKLGLAETFAYTAVALNPNVAAYHDTLGWVLSKRGQVNRAIKTLERAINLQSDAVESHYHLAQVALKADQRPKAIKAIRNVLKLDPAFVHLNVTKRSLSE